METLQDNGLDVGLGALSTGVDVATEQRDTEVRDIESRQENRNKQTYFDWTKGVPIGEKWQATSDQWGATWGAQLMDSYEYDFSEKGELDQEFVDNLGDDHVKTLMMQNGLSGGQSFQRLSKAQNKDHLSSLLRWELQDKARETYINDTLDNYNGMINEQVVGAVVTGLVDIDAPIALATGGGSLVAKATLSSVKAVKAVKAIMHTTAAGAYGTAAVLVNDTSESETTVAQATLFGVLGFAGNAATVHFAGSKVMGKAATNDLDDLTMSEMAVAKETQEATKARLIETQRVRAEGVKEFESLKKSVSDMDAKILKEGAEIDALPLGAAKTNRAKKLEQLKEDAIAAKTDIARREQSFKKMDEEAHFINGAEQRALDAEEASALKVVEDTKTTLKEAQVERKAADKAVKEVAKIEKQIAKDEKAVAKLPEGSKKTKLQKKIDEAKVKRDDLAVDEVGFKKMDENISAIKQAAKEAKDIVNKAQRAAQKLRTKNKVKSNIDKMYKAARKIEKSKNASPIVKTMMRSNAEDMRLMADDFAENLPQWLEHIENLVKTKNAKGLKDLRDAFKMLNDEGIISKAELDQYYKNIENAHSNFAKDLKVKFKLNADGDFVPVTKNGMKKGKKKLVMGAAVLALSTGAMADDGSVIVDGMSLIALLIIGGFVAPHIKSGFKNAPEIMSKMNQYRKTRGIRESINRGISELRTSMTETFYPLHKAESPEFQDLLKKILYDVENGTQLTAERNADRIFHGLMGYMNKRNTKAYVTWLNEKGMNRVKGAMGNMAPKTITNRMQFEMEVMRHVEMGDSVSPAVKEAAATVGEVIESVKQELKASGVKGADEMFDNPKGWMPRYTRGAEIRNTYRGLDAANKAKFVREFARMFKGDVKKAEDYLNMITELGSNDRRMSNMKDIEDFVAKNNLSMTADEIAEELGVAGKATGRTQARIEIDKGKWKDFQVEMDMGNGNMKTIDISLDNIFVSGSSEVMERWVKGFSGHIALADAGFKSVDELVELINTTAISADKADVLVSVVKLMTGEPIVSGSQTAIKLMNTAGNLAVAMKMKFSAISLVQEAFNTMVRGRGNVTNVLAKELVNIFRKHGDSAAYLDEIKEFMGQGMHKYSATYGSVRDITSGMDNISSVAVGGKISETLRDTVLFNGGLVPISDFLTGINLIDTSRYIIDVIHGQKKMSAFERNLYGLDVKTEAILKKVLKQRNGKMEKLNMKSWSREEQLQFYKVVDRMMMKRVQQSTYGGTPNWSRDNLLGIVASKMLAFPLMAFGNHGINDLKGVLLHKDPRSMMAMAAWWTGGYTAAMLRYELQGRDYTEDDLLHAAFWSIPQVGAPEALLSLFSGDTAVQSAMGDLLEPMGEAYSANMPVGMGGE